MSFFIECRAMLQLAHANSRHVGSTLNLRMPKSKPVQVSFDYGASGNESVGAVCGANNISIEFSDETWQTMDPSKLPWNIMNHTSKALVFVLGSHSWCVIQVGHFQILQNLLFPLFNHFNLILPVELVPFKTRLVDVDWFIAWFMMLPYFNVSQISSFGTGQRHLVEGMGCLGWWICLSENSVRTLERGGVWWSVGSEASIPSVTRHFCLKNFHCQYFCHWKCHSIHQIPSFPRKLGLLQELVAAALCPAFPHEFQPSRSAECHHSQAHAVMPCCRAELQNCMSWL